jgi:hypothetical protein
MVIDDLNAAGLIRHVSVEKLKMPESSRKTFNVHYVSDGMVAVLILK